MLYFVNDYSAGAHEKIMSRLLETNGESLPGYGDDKYCISAKEKIRLDRLFELIKFVDTQNAMRISTGKLNDVLANATARVQPPSDKGKRLKIYYMTQASTRPPTFVCFVNNAELFHYSYQRYLDNQIREIFGLEGTPTKMIIRERESGKK